MKIKMFFMLAALCSLMAGGTPAAEVQTGEKVSFQTRDGVLITGLFRKPSSAGNRTCILLHGLGSTQEEWQSFSDRLAAAGYGVLSYDARGHGKSTSYADGRKLSYTKFGPPGPGSQWGNMTDDLGEAINFLASKKGIPVKKIVLIGASIGANICLIYAAKTPEIPLVVLLSPGLNYAGFGTLGSIESFAKRPIAIAASPSDSYAYQSSILLFQRIQGSKKAAFLQGPAGHGVQMFDGKFDSQLLKWIVNH